MEHYLIRFIIAPLFAVIGIIIVGSILENELGIQNATIALFVAVGGIYFFANFFKK